MQFILFSVVIIRSFLDRSMTNDDFTLQFKAAMKQFVEECKLRVLTMEDWLSIEDSVITILLFIRDKRFALPKVKMYEPH